MPTLIISDPSTGKSQKFELQDAMMRPIAGKTIGEVIDGTFAGLQGYKLKITGGTDKDGVPMRPDVHGSGKSHIILSGGVGFHPTSEGARKRKVVRGNAVSSEIKFLSLAVIEAPKGAKPIGNEPKAEKSEDKTE
ncbi:MAG: 30S ribosomal protein S6e [Candidatus Bathyarchaeota archaeon]|nr:30S ribosomal protein S6e [Candidatus Bathyarchaeota archaeon]